MHELFVQFMAHGRDMAFRYRFKNGTTRFGQVMAIVETAVPEIRPEFREGTFEHPFSQVIQAEFLKPGRIDDSCIVIDLVHPGERGGMFPELSTVEISRVAISAPGTSKLTIVDFPMPDCPIRMVDRFSVIGNKAESVSFGYPVAETSWMV